MTNGAKAKQIREKRGKDQKKEPSSQLKAVRTPSLLLYFTITNFLKTSIWII